MESVIQTITIYALPLIFGITLHEAAHAYVARFFGDSTAYQAGRMTLNPIPHIDPFGTIALPLILLLSASLLSMPAILFGWAKPVPVNWGRLRKPKRDMAWVALAGPASNLIMAVFWVLFARVAEALGLGGAEFWLRVAMAGVQVNLVLMALNLVPLLPLDGGRILFSLLPNKVAVQYARMEPYGMPIILILMFTGVLWKLMMPFLYFGQSFVTWFL